MKIRIGCIAVGFLSVGVFVSAQTASTHTLAPSTVAAMRADAPSGGDGRRHYVPLWLSKEKLGDSLIFQTAGNVGIGTTSPYFALDVNGIVNASTSFNLGGSPFAFGSFANRNAFLGFAGNSRITGNYNTAVGSQALFYNTTGPGNTAIGSDALFYNTTGGNTAIGGVTLYYNTTGTGNTAIGTYALTSNTTADWNTATGQQALIQNTTGSANTASGTAALQNNATGNNNTASGFSALVYNTTGNSNTALGYNAGPDANSTNLTNATAIGANAVVSESNALVLGSGVKVGIGTATPANVFTIAQGAGQAISDGWTTYSSRRWKTNIQTLHGALGKVEQLRGVSYDLKANGKHEVGVIAEEVGAVVPEIVSWEKNGKDAQGVDYSRLTPLLIEATKEQQTLIRKQQDQIKAQQAQIKGQEAQSRLQNAQIRAHQAQIKAQQIQIQAERTRSEARFARLTSQVKAIQSTLETNSGMGAEVRTAAVQLQTSRQ